MTDQSYTDAELLEIEERAGNVSMGYNTADLARYYARDCKRLIRELRQARAALAAMEVKVPQPSLKEVNEGLDA